MTHVAGTSALVPSEKPCQASAFAHLTKLRSCVQIPHSEHTSLQFGVKLISDVIPKKNDGFTQNAMLWVVSIVGQTEEDDAARAHEVRRAEGIHFNIVRG